MAFTTFPSVGPYAPEALTADLNTNFGKTVEVALAGVADGEFLVYDGSSSVWINRTSAEAGIPAAVADLTDVTIATVANGEFMIYDGSSASWINATAAEAGVPANLEDLTNVSIATPADGEVLTYDGSSGAWINAAGGAGSSTLADLTDTTITTPSEGQFLVYDTATGKWVNTPISLISSLEKIGTYDLGTVLLSTGNELTVDVSGYDSVQVCVSGGSLASGGLMLLRFSADGGATFRSTSGDYVRSQFTSTTSTPLTNAGAILVAGGLSGTTGHFSALDITGFNDASQPITIKGVLGSVNDVIAKMAYTTNLEAVNTLQFSTNDGTAYTAGTLTLWGNATSAASATTVASLPAGTAGQTSFVTDATVTTFGSIVAGGGANGVPVYSDGTNWRIG